jgi:hypothetical protein
VSPKPWKKRESGILWNLYLAGLPLEEIASRLDRDVDEVQGRIAQLACNEDGLAIFYRPFHRVSRKGKPFTKREQSIIRAHKKRNVLVEATARLLQRDVSELEVGEDPSVKSYTVIAPTLDLVMAHRYIFHVYKARIISDKKYDVLYHEEVEYGGGRKALTEVTKDGFWGPPRVKALALYLFQKYEDEHGGSKPPAK